MRITFSQPDDKVKFESHLSRLLFNIYRALFKQYSSLVALLTRTQVKKFVLVHIDPLSGIGVAGPYSPTIVDENIQHGVSLVERVLMQIRAKVQAAGGITSIPAFELEPPYCKVINTGPKRAIRVVCTR